MRIGYFIVNENRCSGELRKAQKQSKMLGNTQLETNDDDLLVIFMRFIYYANPRLQFLGRLETIVDVIMI